MEWIGAVEDATRLQDVMASAVLNMKVMLAFEVLDSKIANRLRTEELLEPPNKQVATEEQERQKHNEDS